MSSWTLNIARDFSRYPAGRYKTDGPYSGEYCRTKYIVPALKKGDQLVIELDGTLGYGSSFLEEAFGGLVRSEGLNAADLRSKVQLRSDDTSLVQEIWDYVDDAQQVKANS